jgi:putative FmdB family regulatory protein
LSGPRLFRSRPAGKYREGFWLPSQFDRRYLRAEFAPGWSGARTTIKAVPVYEFVCESCGHRFEELVGSHVGREVGDVACPECGSVKVERQLSTYSSPQHQLTPNQKRRLEDKRGIDRGGAKERFKQQRAVERSAARRRRGS